MRCAAQPGADRASAGHRGQIPGPGLLAQFHIGQGQRGAGEDAGQRAGRLAGDCLSQRPDSGLGVPREVQAESVRRPGQRVPGRAGPGFQPGGGARAFAHDVQALESVHPAQQRRRGAQRSDAIRQRPGRRGRLDHRQPVPHRFRLAGQRADPGRAVRGHRAGGDLRLGERVQPAAHLGGPAVVQVAVPVPGDQRDRTGRVPRGQRVLDRLPGGAGHPVPGGRPFVQRGYELGLGRDQLGVQGLGEEMVVAVPLPHLIERDHENVLPLEQVDDLRGIIPPGHRVAQRGAEPVQDRGPGEELADPGGQLAEYLLGQEVGDEPVVPGEFAHEVGGCGLPAQGERGQLDAGWPAFGPLNQAGQVGLAQLDTGHGPGEPGGVRRAEPQLRHPDLDQVTSRPEPGQRQRWIGPADHHQQQGRREVCQQGRDLLVARWLADQLVVIEHQHDLPRERGQRVDQHRQHGASQVGGGHAQRLPDVLAVEAGAGPVQRGHQMPAQPGRVVVARIEGQPGERPVLGRAGPPLGHQGGLAEPGRRTDQHQLGGTGRHQPLDQRVPWHPIRARGRRVQLGLDRDLEAGPGQRRVGDRTQRASWSPVLLSVRTPRHVLTIRRDAGPAQCRWS